MFSSRFMLFPTCKKKNKLVYKNNLGDFLILRFMLFSTLKKNTIEKFPFT